MAEETVEITVVAAAKAIESPPKVTVVETAATDPRQELVRLAGEVARVGSRKLLWEYLRLRSRVVGK